MTNAQPDAPPDRLDGPITRRRVFIAAAGSAALAGTGVAWLRAERPPTAPNPAFDDAFWSLQWETPRGTRLSMQAFRGRPLLLNFWATWCPPCVEELPLINNFYRQNKANGWQVLGLAIDKLAPVQAFLKKMPLDFPIALAGLSGAELARSLGNLAGGLPFSVVVGSEGAVLHRKLGRLTDEDLKSWVRLK